jgi:hypothetical protein
MTFDDETLYIITFLKFYIYLSLKKILILSYRKYNIDVTKILYNRMI